MHKINHAKCLVVVVITVCAAFTVAAAVETNPPNSEVNAVARSGSFEGLHVELQYCEKGGWGCITNGMVSAMLCRNNTNVVTGTDLVSPSPGQTAIFVLRDDKGKPVLLRDDTKFHSPPPTLNLPLDGRVNRRIHGCPYQLDWFCLDSQYMIKRTGEYELEAAPRFYQWRGPQTRAISLITNFPTVKIRLHLNRNDGN
jgi:hypothetical protein